MKIEPTGFLTYLAKDKYTVDLAANGCFGQCDCAHFRCRVAPSLKTADRLDPCKHIVACQISAWRQIAPAIVGKREKPQHWHGMD